jgi:hypothetical protein
MCNAIFIHAAILNKSKERILQYLEIFQKSGLTSNVSFIYICFIGSQTIPIDEIELVRFNSNNNIKLIKLSENLSEYEVPTLQFIHNFCKENPDYNILYLHTKNVGKVKNECIEQQIEYMLYFLAEQWKKCLDVLKTSDTCGVDLRSEPVLHYSGNFWWSSARNILSLPSPNDFNNLEKYPNPLNSLRHNQEFWICYNKQKSHNSLWDCGINVYERHLHLYPKELYRNAL